jgi:hypothetical protein
MDLMGSRQIYTKFRDRKQKLLQGEVTRDSGDTGELVEGALYPTGIIITTTFHIPS